MREVLDERARLQRMLDFEVALGARAGGSRASFRRMPSITSPARHTPSATISRCLGKKRPPAGNIAIPLIAALTAEVAKTDPTAAATCTGARPARTSSIPRSCSISVRRSML